MCDTAASKWAQALWNLHTVHSNALSKGVVGQAQIDEAYRSLLTAYCSLSPDEKRSVRLPAKPNTLHAGITCSYYKDA